MTHADTDHRPVTVLGAGALGTTLARAFLAGGHPVTVWNRTAGRVSALVELGAAPAASVAEAVAATDVVVASVATYDDLDAVLAPVARSGGLTGRTLVNLVSGTPEQARATATWAAGQGAAYLDGAAMSGTRLIGTPEALFLYGGPADAFAATEATLATLGLAVHLGADPGLTGVYDTALLGVIMGALAGFYHAAALVGASGVDVRDFAPVAARHLESFVAGLVVDHGRQIAERHYPGDDGTISVLAAATGHLVETGRRQGVGGEVPETILGLLDRAVAAGHGDDGVARIAELLAAP